jgi:hypothetical protein
MQLKTIKPAHGAFADFGYILENLVAFHTPVVTDGDFGTVCEGYTGTFTRADRVDKNTMGTKTLCSISTKRL